jgi:phosphate transport system substrate-binding protein
MVRLGQRWAEEYMKKNPNVVIQVSGGGSGTGISAMINGTTDICQASRDIKTKEVEELEKQGAKLFRYRVALDGIAVFVHESNPIQEISIDQLRRIYTGEVTNWKEVGGIDEKIVLYSRENNSGTYAYFKEAVLREADFSSWTSTLPGTSAVVNAVSKDSLGIGYGGIAWASGVKHCMVKSSDSTVAFAPTLELISNGQYPISRPLFWFTRSEPVAEIKNFLNWALSVDGQKIAEETHYVPLHSDEAASQIIQ